MAADRVAICTVGQFRPAETLMLVLPTLCAAPYRGPLNLGDHMQKTPIAADALIHIFREELRPLSASNNPPTVAIVPVPVHGWAAVTSQKDRRRHPQLAAQTAKIEKTLRQRYRLEDS